MLTFRNDLRKEVGIICERSEFVTNVYEDTAYVAKFERVSNNFLSVSIIFASIYYGAVSEQHKVTDLRKRR